MSNLFISYSSKNREAANKLSDRLKAEGYPAPFLAPHEADGIPVGTEWELELRRQLKLCQALLVLCSEVWLQSQWCLAELFYARALHKEILPIKVGPCRPPAFLESLQSVDLEMEGEEGYAKLWASLRGLGLLPRERAEKDAMTPPNKG